MKEVRAASQRGKTLHYCIANCSGACLIKKKELRDAAAKGGSFSIPESSNGFLLPKATGIPLDKGREPREASWKKCESVRGGDRRQIRRFGKIRAIGDMGRAPRLMWGLACEELDTRP